MKSNFFRKAFLILISFPVFLNGFGYDTAKASYSFIDKYKPVTFRDNRLNFNGQAIPILSKSYKFGEYKSGDCVMKAGGTLHIYSDGHAIFKAIVYTNIDHGSDTWYHHVYFTNSAGVVLFQIVLNGPTHMKDNGTHYPFNATFKFPAAIFKVVSKISVEGDC